MEDFKYRGMEDFEYRGMEDFAYNGVGGFGYNGRMPEIFRRRHFHNIRRFLLRFGTLKVVEDVGPGSRGCISTPVKFQLIASLCRLSFYDALAIPLCILGHNPIMAAVFGYDRICHSHCRLLLCSNIVRVDRGGTSPFCWWSAVTW